MDVIDTWIPWAKYISFVKICLDTSASPSWPPPHPAATCPDVAAPPRPAYHHLFPGPFQSAPASPSLSCIESIPCTEASFENFVSQQATAWKTFNGFLQWNKSQTPSMVEKVLRGWPPTTSPNHLLLPAFCPPHSHHPDQHFVLWTHPDRSPLWVFCSCWFFRRKHSFHMSGLLPFMSPFTCPLLREDSLSPWTTAVLFGPLTCLPHLQHLSLACRLDSFYVCFRSCC